MAPDQLQRGVGPHEQAVDVLEDAHGQAARVPARVALVREPAGPHARPHVGDREERERREAPDDARPARRPRASARHDGLGQRQQREGQEAVLVDAERERAEGEREPRGPVEVGQHARGEGDPAHRVVQVGHVEDGLVGVDGEEEGGRRDPRARRAARQPPAEREDQRRRPDVTAERDQAVADGPEPEQPILGPEHGVGHGPVPVAGDRHQAADHRAERGGRPLQVVEAVRDDARAEGRQEHGGARDGEERRGRRVPDRAAGSGRRGLLRAVHALSRCGAPRRDHRRASGRASMARSGRLTIPGGGAGRGPRGRGRRVILRRASAAAAVPSRRGRARSPAWLGRRRFPRSRGPRRA